MERVHDYFPKRTFNNALLVPNALLEELPMKVLVDFSKEFLEKELLEEFVEEILKQFMTALLGILTDFQEKKK